MDFINNIFANIRNNIDLEDLSDDMINDYDRSLPLRRPIYATKIKKIAIKAANQLSDEYYYPKCEYLDLMYLFGYYDHQYGKFFANMTIMFCMGGDDNWPETMKQWHRDFIQILSTSDNINFILEPPYI